MSLDIYFQGFRGGGPVPGGGDRMRTVLEPYASRQEPPSNFWLVQIGDGTADVYLDDDHMMANRISGQDPWDLLVKGAQAAGCGRFVWASKRSPRFTVRFGQTRQSSPIKGPASVCLA